LSCCTATVREVTDVSLRNEITSKLALICLRHAECAAEQTANGVTGIAKLILELFRAGAELAEECGDATTRGWCLSGQGWMTVTGDGSDTQLLKSLELYKEAHDILLPLNEPGHKQMRLINSWDSLPTCTATFRCARRRQAIPGRCPSSTMPLRCS
jgi:hypothetical protein